MSRLLLVSSLAALVAGCATHTSAPGPDYPSRGLESVNVPVVARQDYAIDVAAPGGSLAPSEAARLDGWFRGLGLGYGDSIYVDGDYGGVARSDIARVAGTYGLLVSSAAPITAGQIAPGTVRVVVSRTRASVPNCPNWSDAANGATYNNATMSNFGCAMNTNLAAMIANPQDLVQGRDAGGVSDNLTSSKALEYYRSAPPSAAKGLEDVSTKKKDQ